MAVIQTNEIKVPFLGSRISFIPGLDPMGLLNVSERTFGMLLPGLNIVTDRIRYYSFYGWFFTWYSREIGISNKKTQRTYLRRAEYLLALLAAKTGVQGINGITKAKENYREDLPLISLTEGTGEDQDNFENTYWKNAGGIFGQNYVSSLRQMGIIRDQDEETKVYIATNFKREGIVSGFQLAEAFAANLSEAGTQAFTHAVKQGAVSQQELALMVEDFNMKRVPPGSEESKLLIQMIISQDEPLQDQSTWFRRTTCRWYFEQTQTHSGKVSVLDFTAKAYHDQGVASSESDPTLTGWYYYQLDQFWQIVSTGCLAHFLKALNTKGGDGWYPENKLIEEISEEVMEWMIEEKLIQSAEVSFASFPNMEEDAFTLTEQSRKDDEYRSGMMHSFLLLQKIMVDNESRIAGLLEYGKEFDLLSPSNFVQVYADLKKHSSKPAIEFIQYFLRKYVIFRHQFVAIRKMNQTQSTEKFLREDGLIRHLDDIGFGFSSPRLGSLIQFFQDLVLIEEETGELTEMGEELLAKIKGLRIEN